MVVAGLVWHFYRNSNGEAVPEDDAVSIEYVASAVLIKSDHVWYLADAIPSLPLVHPKTEVILRIHLE